MKLNIEKLGGISKAGLELNDLTILVGPNNSGKTYITYTLYGVLKYWHDFVNISDSNFKNFEEKLINEGQVTLSVDETRRFISSSIRKQSNAFQNKRIRELFNDKERLLAGALIEFEIQLPESFIDRQISVEFGSSRIDGEIKNQKLTFAYTKHKNFDFPTQILRSILRDLLSQLIIRELFPEPLIVTAERLGISLFYKELDATRNSLIQSLQELDADDGKQLSQIIRDSAYYAVPIKDHIDFTRGLDKLQQSKCSIDSSPSIEIIKQMLGGEFKKSVRQEIRFHTKHKRNNKFDIPLYLASSSTRCIMDLYFYLKHKAKHGDLLIIDEPESHLTLRNQRLMAKLIASIVRQGVRVFITTHSDFLIKELNNLIRLNDDFPGKREWLFKNSFYNVNDSLSPSRVSVYQSEDGGLKKVETDRNGISIPFFDEELVSLFRTSADLEFITSEEAHA